MPRKTHNEIAELMKKENVSRIFSWSKWDTFYTSHYEYFLKYIKKVAEDRADCIYPVTGSLAHDILERFYKGEIPYEDMSTNFEDGWVTSYEIAKLKFDRNDEKRNESISNKYYADLSHFFKHHKVLTYKVLLEQFAKVKVGNELFQGYIDVCFKDENDNYQIIDWKTSSIYKGVTAIEKCGQLVLYAMALNQAGIPLNKIKIGWNFLKYVRVTHPLKNGTIKERTIERFEIGSKLKSNVKIWLKEAGYDNEQIVNYLDILEVTNSLDELPTEVAEKYQIEDCYEYVDLTDELIKKWTNTIIQVINQIDYCEKEYAETQSEKVWWDTDENLKKQSYYFATLSSYSPNLHLPYKAYIESLEAKAECKDLFTGIGGATDDTLPWEDSGDNNIFSSTDLNDDDLSWLNNI